MSGVPLASGHLIDGRYRLQEMLRSGAFGWVYRAVDEQCDRRQVAVKIMRTDHDQHDHEVLAGWFRREVETLSYFQKHPQIVHLLDSRLPGQDGLHYYVMEFIEGQRWADLSPPLPANELLRYGDQVAQALQALHQQGFIHRDVTPRNIVIHPERGAILIDFGTVRSVREPGEQSRNTTIVQTEYAPPEQLQGHPEPRSDQYALGCILMKYGTGAGLPPSVLESFQRAGAAKPEDRYPSMEDFRQAFTGETEATTVQLSAAERPAVRWRDRVAAVLREVLCPGWGNHFAAPRSVGWLTLQLIALTGLTPFWLVAWRNDRAGPHHVLLVLFTLLWLPTIGHGIWYAWKEAPGGAWDRWPEWRWWLSATLVFGLAFRSLNAMAPNPLMPDDVWRAGLIWSAAAGVLLGPGGGAAILMLAGWLGADMPWLAARAYFVLVLGGTTALAGLLWEREAYGRAALVVLFALLGHVLQWDLQHATFAGSGQLLGTLAVRLQSLRLYQHALWLVISALLAAGLAYLLRQSLQERRWARAAAQQLALRPEFWLAAVALLTLGLRPVLTGARLDDHHPLIRWAPAESPWWWAALLISLWPWWAQRNQEGDLVRRWGGLSGGLLWLGYFMLTSTDSALETILRAGQVALLLGSSWCALTGAAATWNVAGAVLVLAGRLIWPALLAVGPLAFLAQRNLRQWNWQSPRAQPAVKAAVWLAAAYLLVIRWQGVADWLWWSNAPFFSSPVFGPKG